MRIDNRDADRVREALDNAGIEYNHNLDSMDIQYGIENGADLFDACRIAERIELERIGKAQLEAEEERYW